ncbi:MAG TPA: ABC transporter permease subunit [Candidatus Binatia bacterium]|nr:ABC transporter permease subunit [Candidatus Binatia bacterium]
MFFAQFKNELVKLFGKKRTYIGFGAFVLVQVLMMFMFKYSHWQERTAQLLEGNGYIASEYISVLTVSVVMLMPQIALLMPLYTTLVGGDMVAKEVEDGTLRMILARPISRFRLLLVKWTAGVFFGVLLVLLLGVSALALAGTMFPWKGMFVFVPGQAFSVLPAGSGLSRFIFAHLFLAMNAGVMLSIAFMFSCWNMKPAAATILALSFLFVNAVLERIPFFEEFQNWFITHHFASWLLVFQTPVPWPQIIQSQIILIAVNVTAFIIGSMAFQTRDIKS